MSGSELGIGQWGLFSGPEGKQLIAIDGQPCGPVSARKITQGAPRRLLLDEGRIERIVSGAVDQLPAVVEFNGQRLRVEAKPVVSPWSRTVVGVHAGVWPEGEKVPAPPLAGSWEWVVALKDGEIVGRRTFWNQELFDLYEVDSAVAQQQSGYWEVDVWASELVAEGDQLRFFSSLRDGYWDSWTGVRCATFDAIAGYGTDYRHKKHLRLVAQQGRMTTENRLIFQGFSYEVPEVFADRALAEEYPTDNALTSFMKIVKDPMAIVDPFSLEVLMSTPAWREEDFGSARALQEALAEDPVPVRDFLIDAVDSGEERTSELLMRSGGGQREFHVCVIGMDRGAQKDALAVVRLNA